MFKLERPATMRGGGVKFLGKKYEKKGKNLCFWLLFRSVLSLLLTPFLFHSRLFPLPFFLLTFSLPLPLPLTSGGYLVWLCDSLPAMGQPALGLDVRLQCISANVGQRGKVVDQSVAFADFTAACFMGYCHVI